MCETESRLLEKHLRLPDIYRLVLEYEWGKVAKCALFCDEKLYAG